MFERVKDDPTITKIILQKNAGVLSLDQVGQNVKFVYAESLRGAYYLATSKVILLGYALRSMSSFSDLATRRHFIVQLWHGIPLRGVGRLFSREPWWKSETSKYSAALASSPQDRLHIREVFSPIPEARIWLTGLPRNDFILGDEVDLPSDYRSHLSDLRVRTAGRRLVLYAPTWRDDEKELYAFSTEERNRLERLLKKNNAVLGIRGHSNRRRFSGYADDGTSTFIFSLNDFPDVNIILRDTSVLVTDYSSIFVDFLLTQRPIIHFAYDLESYIASREGFLYDLEEAFPGPVTRSFDDLLEELELALTTGIKDADRYTRVADLFHSHEKRSGVAVTTHIRTLSGLGSG